MTREDENQVISWMHREQEKSNIGISKLFEAVARLEEQNKTLAAQVIRLENVKPPERPCDAFKEHLQDHKRTEERWYGTTIKVILGTVIGGFIVWVGNKIK